MKKRRYTLKARAESQEETRQRITAAAAELHEALGPAQTSITAIAERAGVERLTVYRHFPDELALLRACGAHYRALHPPPAPARWEAIAAPRRRLDQALTELYRHFRDTEGMWSHVLADAEKSVVVRQAAEPRFHYLREAATVLSRGFTGLAPIAITHAVQFTTWQSFARAQVGDETAVRLMVLLATVAARR
jgi:AcrR family transcriptional regulator